MGLLHTGAPRRRPVAGGYARGEETRARIVAAALQVFADEGYVRAATRQIAEAAGVNPPALQYYFDSKEGLHRACADHIIGLFTLAMAGAMEAAELAVSREDPAVALDALCDLLDSLADFCMLKKDGPDWSRFSGRTLADGVGPGFARMGEAVSKPLHRLVAKLVGAILGEPADSEQIALRATTIMGPITTFHVTRATTLTNLGWTDYDAGRLAAVKAVVRAHTRAALRTAGTPSP